MVQGERYALAAAIMQSTFRVLVVAGAAAGGLTVALLGARPALGFDAATFVISALLIKFGVLARPAAAASVPSALRQLGSGIRVVFGDRALRILLMLGWLAAFYEIPGGIAAPYAARLGGGPDGLECGEAGDDRGHTAHRHVAAGSGTKGSRWCHIGGHPRRRPSAR